MTQAMYAATRAGKFEVKVLPARRGFEARADRDFFQVRNELFRRNFAFLKRNALEMTVPVKARFGSRSRASPLSNGRVESWTRPT
jgi:hypothetical protein